MPDSGDSQVLDIISDQIIGYIYTLVWGLAFLAQIRMNYQLKNTEGCNLDYVVYNFIGQIFYFIFICSGSFMQEYSQVNGVHIYDTLFAVWAVIMASIILIQCFFIYEKGQNRISKMCLGAVFSYSSFCFLWAILTNITGAFVPTSKFYNTFFIMNYFYILITITKYIPQILWNNRRKSTEGWSILMIQLEFFGGFILILQIILNSINDKDETFQDSMSSSIVLHIAKFELAMICILFGTFFMFQHYFMYDPKRRSKQFRTSKYNDLNMQDPLQTRLAENNDSTNYSPFVAEMK